MSIQSAMDHGYCVDWSIRVEAGLICGFVDHDGLQFYRVTDRWAPLGKRVVCITSGPRNGELMELTDHRILADAYAE